MPKLTKEDWVEIYYALEYKKQYSAAVVGDKNWNKHLETIMRKIGPDGKNMTKEPETKRPVKMVVAMYGGTFESVKIDNPTVELDVIITENKKYSENSDEDIFVTEDDFVYSWLDSEVDVEGVQAIHEKNAEARKQYLNHYRCECGEEWTDQWSCLCNDRCSKCNKEIEPYKSDELQEVKS